MAAGPEAEIPRGGNHKHAEVSDASTRGLVAGPVSAITWERGLIAYVIARVFCEEGSAIKKRTRVYWVAGITGALVGASALASAATGTDHSADGYDLALLSDATIASPASALPDAFDFATLEDEIDPGTLRLVGTSGHAAIFTAFSAAGELCVISSIDVSADEWAVGSGCQSPDSFNARGAATRMTSPTESVEAYLLPDRAVAALRAAGHNLTSTDAPNVVFIDAYETGDERARLSKTLLEVGVMVYPEGESDG